jgi:capsular exopolysaccharide synthesis family protein
MSDKHEAQGIDLGALVGIVRRRFGLVVLAVIVAAGGALVFSLLQDEEYSASASLLPEAASSSAGFSSPFAGQAPDRQAATNLELAGREIIARRTSERLERRGELAAAAAVSGVEVKGQGESDLIEVKATAASPTAAARVANAFADEYVAFRRDADRAKIRQSQAVLRRELDKLLAARARLPDSLAGSARRRGRALGRRIGSIDQRLTNLRLLASLQTGNAVVVDRARPAASPSSPKPVRNTAIGAFAGLLLGLALALTREQLDRRLRDSKELEDAFGLPVLARLPESDALGGRNGMGHDLPPFEAEAFRMLRANLRYLESGRKVDSVLITSSSVEDGKSTVAFHLAAAAAATGLKVLLIEADVRRPILARSLGLPPSEGLISLLAGKERGFAYVCHEVLLTRNSNGRSSPPTMDVVPAGEVSSDASELIESEQMQELVRESKREYSLVVIDTPPVGLVSDAIPLMSEVSAVIVVGRVGELTGEEAHRLREQLEQVNAPTVGVVANFTRLDDGGYDLAVRHRAQLALGS